MMRTISLGVLVLVLSGGVALAQPAPGANAQATAEKEFLAGNTAYNLGRFDEAITHFTKAYEAWPQPEFLYNIAQSYRLAGNCKQALYFYKRFRSLKERDTASPLTPQKREEVDRLIEQQSECVAKVDTGAAAQPQTLDRPGSTTTTTPVKTTGELESPDDAEEDAEEDEEEDAEEDETELHAQTTAGAKVVSARVESGIAILGGGGEDLEFPVQPAFSLSGGYPLPAGPAIVEVGAGLTYTPLPYEAMGEQKQGAMLGVRAMGVGVYPVAPKISLRGSLGLGIVSLSGLAMGNPITTDRSAQSFTLLNVRVGVAADYAITPNIVATVQPFAFAYSPGSDGMYADSLREIDVLFGVGYRQ